MPDEFPLCGDCGQKMNRAETTPCAQCRRIAELYVRPLKELVERMQTLGQHPDFHSDADELLVIDDPEGAIGQLVPAINPDASAGLGREIDAAIEEETFTPSVLLGRDDGETLPVAGITLLYKMRPAMWKLMKKRKLYGPFLVELCRRLLALADMGDDLRVKLKWPEALPVDMLQLRQALLIDQQMGVASKATIAQKLDYDWESEQANIAQEGSSEGVKALGDAINGAVMPAPGTPVNQQSMMGQQNGDG